MAVSSSMKPKNSTFSHPYEPYGIQLEFMQNLYQCIEDRAVGIFESPTGTGKSLSLICAALTWLRDDERRRLIGDDAADGDWLTQSEQDILRKQLLENRRDLEEKLITIRNKNGRKQDKTHQVKRPRIDDGLCEDDLALDDYDSDAQDSRGVEDQLLDPVTIDLLKRFKPKPDDNDHEDGVDKPQILFCSRTHSQLSQIVGELRKVKIRSSLAEDMDIVETIKHISLGSRKNLCINPKVHKLPTTAAVNERCLDLQKPGVDKDSRCGFLPKQKSDASKEKVEEFRDRAIAELQDIEDIADLGKRMNLCPYYASRTAISSCEVLTLPYPLLLQQSAREALGLSLRQKVVIVDEAHNLDSAISEIFSVTVPLSHLVLALAQLHGYCQKFKNRLKGKNRVYIAQIIKIMKSCITAISSRTADTILSSRDLLTTQGLDQTQPIKLIRYIHESKLAYKVEGYAELSSTASVLNKSSSANPQPRGVLAEFQNLLVALINPASEGKFFLMISGQEKILKYSLLDPQEHFREVISQARTVILAGGTMSPMSAWSEFLFSYLDSGRLRTYSFGHIVHKNNVFVQPVVSLDGTDFDFTFASRKNESMLQRLGQVILTIAKAVPDGMIVFLPSYDYLDTVLNVFVHFGFTALLEANKRLFHESRGANTDQLLADYTATISAGKEALMFAIVGGKLSEGINFADRMGRAVVCVGIPYPNIKSVEWKAKLDFLEQREYLKLKQDGVIDAAARSRAQSASREYTDNVTMRAVNQSIGRAIRHKNDYAAIYLVDKRYATSRIQSKLPMWLRQSIRESTNSAEVLRRSSDEFFLSMNDVNQCK